MEVGSVAKALDLVEPGWHCAKMECLTCGHLAIHVWPCDSIVQCGKCGATGDFFCIAEIDPDYELVPDDDV